MLALAAALHHYPGCLSFLRLIFLILEVKLWFGLVRFNLMEAFSVLIILVAGENAWWADLRIFAWRFWGLKRAIAIGESVVGISSLEFRSLELGAWKLECWF